MKKFVKLSSCFALDLTKNVLIYDFFRTISSNDKITTLNFIAIMLISYGIGKVAINARKNYLGLLNKPFVINKNVTLFN